MNCLRCDRPMRSRGAPRPDYTRNALGYMLPSDGKVQAGSFGLCTTCTGHTRRNGMVIDFDTKPNIRPRKPTVDTVEDFEFLTETMGVRCRANRFGWTRASMRHIAARLNITLDALEHALDRARKAAA